MSQTTQEHLSIKDITQDLILLKDGGASLVIKTNAVNFGLLSEMEQISIIGSFAQMLNSLSYSIQIVIESQRLDVSSYITMLEAVQRSQANPLLATLIAKYRQFVQSLVKENDVLDKQFYIILTISSLELGLRFLNNEEKLAKIKALLNPRRDQLTRQLTRVGLTTEQLKTEQLVKLFYEIYNQSVSVAPQVIDSTKLVQPVHLTNPQPIIPQMPQPTQSTPVPTQPIQQSPSPQAFQQPVQNIPVAPAPVPQTPNIVQPQRPSTRNHPFVVEELSDAI